MNVLIANPMQPHREWVYEPRLLQAFKDLTGHDPTACVYVTADEAAVLRQHAAANDLEVGPATHEAIMAARKGELFETGTPEQTIAELNA